MAKSIDDEYDYTFKLVIIGDSNVGKSSLVLRYADKTFDAEINPTVGNNFTYRSIKINGKRIKLKIWDTAGQERFRTMAANFYKDASGVIVVYDVMAQESFENIQRWLIEVNEHAPPGVAVTILGNKCDCAEVREKAVRTETGRKFATDKGYQFMETSCKMDVNVSEAIDRSVKIMIGPVVKKKG